MEFRLSDQPLPAGFRDGSSSQTTDQRMRRRCRQPPPPCKEVPDNGPGQRRENDVLSYLMGIHQTAADGFRDLGAEEDGRKIKDRRPQDRQLWRKNTSQYDSRYAVGCIVEAVDEIKGQRNHDETNNHPQT